jgi:hypothetical protein
MCRWFKKSDQGLDQPDDTVIDRPVCVEPLAVNATNVAKISIIFISASLLFACPLKYPKCRNKHG